MELAALHDALYQSLNNNDMYNRLKETAERFKAVMIDQEK